MGTVRLVLPLLVALLVGCTQELLVDLTPATPLEGRWRGVVKIEQSYDREDLLDVQIGYRGDELVLQGVYKINAFPQPIYSDVQGAIVGDEKGFQVSLYTIIGVIPYFGRMADKDHIVLQRWGNADETYILTRLNAKTPFVSGGNTATTRPDSTEVDQAWS